MIPKAFALSQSNVLDSMVRHVPNVIGSDHSNISDDLSECESLNEYRKSFLTKAGPCVITKEMLKLLNNNSELFSVNELESMNETWENQSMISFATFRKIKVIAFISWQV